MVALIKWLVFGVLVAMTFLISWAFNIPQIEAIGYMIMNMILTVFIELSKKGK